jgi:hypothetical protein
LFYYIFSALFQHLSLVVFGSHPRRKKTRRSHAKMFFSLRFSLPFAMKIAKG